MFLVCQISGEGKVREVTEVTGVVPELSWGPPFTFEKVYVRMPMNIFHGAHMRASMLCHPTAKPGIAYVNMPS